MINQPASVSSRDWNMYVRKEAGESTRAIAADHGISPSYVNTRLQRVRKEVQIKQLRERDRDSEVTQLLMERDFAEEMADRLAWSIADLLGIELSEHSSSRDPWREAWEAAETEIKRRRTEKDRAA